MNKKINANTIYKNLLAQNMKTAKGIWSPFVFKSLVQNKGQWDLKNNMKTIYGLANYYKDGTLNLLSKVKNMEDQDKGNRHFGAAGKAYGFFLVLQVGAAQMSAGTSKPE